MAFNYPNGQSFDNRSFKQPRVSQGGSQSNRGMSLEADINAANNYYLATGQAVIHKKPTPIQIVNVSYPARSAAKITEAYFRQASTTDYNGIYKGYYIDFDAKETTHKRSFPLNNIHDHQVEHLKSIVTQHGLAFMIIRFSVLKETYVVWADLIFQYWDNKETGRKSIPYEVVVKSGELIAQGINPTTPYLTAVDKLLARREQKGDNLV
ncbi:Holliday junction resolvase RecU [Weissella paramesenteroides]|jgi:recombination protein U|uniref:Holliday junction resolvase RecU n=1 Tax=Weissella paramesenteroides TaxID=1249 RepID=A0A4Q7IV85_WEIPA|nr:Holliday junction resolvase RecU [Weissella paramesenteroides]KAA8441023.1 Holliday junction resolvase RecU [Weissella paramesenteroides]KAA8441199.1 Holliday junction resolvase RecU [Weissella paramesenteroides]KAA8443455.1 Holliday junction resolvase RecU [Weissella paramesenteroides]KAA8446596.1 Holliday junction resolvase RecU [Weissella paramesenteroides]KAA8447743.1 Holliday junction resolvase RecU [Weissella paramesenteroides]